MKTTLIMAVALIFTVKLASAQTEKGTQNLGINLNVAGQNLSGTAYDYTENGLAPTGIKVNQFSFGVTYSYFLADKLDIGADLNGSHLYTSETPNSDPEKQTQNSYSADVFLRKYFMCSSKFGFRAGPYVGYGKLNDTYDYITNYTGALTNSTTQSIYGGIALDLVYYPLKHFGVSATLANAQYAHEKQNNGDAGDNTSNNYGISLITNGVALSLFYAFGGK